MKLLLQTFFAILCLIMVDVSLADEFEAQKAACSEDTSRKWDKKLNRCMTTQSTKNKLGNYRNCTLFEKKTDRDKCMRDLVIAVSGGVELEDNNWDDVTMNIISTGISATNLFYRTKGKSPCVSLQIASGCGIAAIAKDAYIFLQAKKVIKGNLEDFQEKVKDEADYDTQILAYETQIKELNSLSEFYSEKEKLHNMIAACYTASAAATYFDEVKLTVTCVDQASEDSAPEDQAPEDQVSKTPPVGGDAEAVPKPEELEKGFFYYASTPAGVGVLSLLNTTWNLIKAKNLRKQAKKANLLAKRAEVAKDQFVTAMGSYCPEGHENKADLMCYCYENGEKKANRTNSNSCQALWAKNDRNLFAESKDKTMASAKDPNQMGCLTQVGKFDPKCQCKKFKDAQGNNACKKANFSSIKLAGLGQAMDISQLESDLNNVYSGISAKTGFDLTPAQSSALGGKVRDQILKNVKIEDKNGVRTATNKDLAVANEALLSKVTKHLAANPSKPGQFNQDLQAIQQEVEAAIKKKTAASETSKLKMTGGKGASLKGKKKNFALNLGSSSGSVESYPEYMNKTYKTKNADVVTNKDVSIFKVLSNRYYKSGFKRLFED